MKEGGDENIVQAESDKMGDRDSGLPPPTDQIDRHVGRRIRDRREELGISQGRLARHLNLTFSQIQKYEKGQNRIGAGRLYRLGMFLDVPVSYFFEGVGRSERARLMPLPKEETEQLQRAFSRISDPDARRAVLSLVASLVDAEGSSAD